MDEKVNRFIAHYLYGTVGMDTASIRGRVARIIPGEVCWFALYRTTTLEEGLGRGNWNSAEAIVDCSLAIEGPNTLRRE